MCKLIYINLHIFKRTWSATEWAFLVLTMSASVLELIDSYCMSYCMSLFLWTPHVATPIFFQSSFPRIENTGNVATPFAESLYVRVRVRAFLGSHNWISPGKSEPWGSLSMIYDECSRFLPLSYPLCPSCPPVRTRVSTQEPIFHRHCLVGYTTSRDLPFFPRLASVSPPAFLLNRLHLPLTIAPSFRRPRRRRCRPVVTPPRLFLLFRSTPSDTSRHSHAVLLATPTSFPFIPQIERHEPLSPPPILSQFWVLPLTFLHGGG